MFGANVSLPKEGRFVEGWGWSPHHRYRTEREEAVKAWNSRWFWFPVVTGDRQVEAALCVEMWTDRIWNCS